MLGWDVEEWRNLFSRFVWAVFLSAAMCLMSWVCRTLWHSGCDLGRDADDGPSISSCVCLGWSLCFLFLFLLGLVPHTSHGFGLFSSPLFGEWLLSLWCHSFFCRMKLITVQVEYSFSKLLRTESLKLRVFLGFEIVVSMPRNILWINSCLHMKFISISCCLYTNILKVILYSIFRVPSFLLRPITLGQVWRLLLMLSCLCSENTKF